MALRIVRVIDRNRTILAGRPQGEHLLSQSFAKSRLRATRVSASRTSVFRSKRNARTWPSPIQFGNQPPSIRWTTVRALASTRNVPSGLGSMTAPTTRLHDRTLIVVSREGKVSKPGYVSWAPGGESIASAAASCTHFFVSTTEGLLAYDAKTFAQKSAVPWMTVGRSAPVIGPSWHVYAMANDYLYKFPAPLGGGVTGTTACDGLSQTTK